MKYKLVLASFFKESKITYYFYKEEMFFQCLFCEEKAIISTKTTMWKCSACGNSGNLASLIAMIKKQENRTVSKRLINPRKQKNQIKYILRILMQEEQQKKTRLIRLLQKKLDELWDHFQLS
ncbi:MAG TPA: hypothetical protein DEP07_07715 [Brevibacillus sp.]|nr:hypothetical protein [Brevibacillus sp.]